MVAVVVVRGCSIRFGPLVSTILATNSLCHRKTGTEREGRTGGVVCVCVCVCGGGGVLTHSFSPFVNVITGNEFCLCDWKVGTEREGRTGGGGGGVDGVRVVVVGACHPA